ncbi:MAG TPA: OsmC family protein, partial [Calidithermus sp.]|nr:OsmC family protein [Calidithermus sp.]
MAEWLNDVNVDGIRDLDRKVRENPALGKRTVKVHASWLGGTKTLVDIGEHQNDGRRVTPRTRRFVMTADAPPGLGGVDAAPAAVEVLLAALAGCLTSGIAANAALFDVPLEALTVDLEADIDLRGLLGHD